MTAKKTKPARKPVPATDRHIGVRVTPELAAALETRRMRMIQERPGSNVTLSDVVRITLHREVEGTSIRLTPLAARAAVEGAEREGAGVHAYVERLILDAIPEAE